MNIEHIAPWIGALSMVLAVVNTLWIWHQASRLPTQTALAKVACDIDLHDSRIQSLESDIKHLPTKEEIVLAIRPA